MGDRLLRGVRLGRWLDSPGWLPAGEAPADCLSDLRAGDSELSVYVVPEKANPAQVAIALAGTKQRIEESGYILFDVKMATALGIVIQERKGKTADPLVNTWHRDLVELSAGTLAELAK